MTLHLNLHRVVSVRPHTRTVKKPAVFIERTFQLAFEVAMESMKHDLEAVVDAAIAGEKV